MGLMFLGCSTLQKRVNIASCKFSLKGAKLKNVNLNGFSLEVLMGIHNPNSIDAVLDRFSGQVFLEGVKLADVSNRYGRTVKAGRSATVPIEVSVRYSYLKEVASKLADVVKNRRANVRVVGRAYMDFEIPFVGKRSFSYPVNLSRTFKL